MISFKRYLIATLRKRTMCHCGCRGWCTLWHFFRMIWWSLRALADGAMPASRHDQEPWTRNDAERAGRAGEALGFKCALIYLKLDWAEASSSFGFPTWSDALRPCFACNAFGSTMFAMTGITVDHLQSWIENDDADYFRSCDNCEIVHAE